MKQKKSNLVAMYTKVPKEVRDCINWIAAHHGFSKARFLTEFYLKYLEKEVEATQDQYLMNKVYKKLSKLEGNRMCSHLSKSDTPKFPQL